jgi:RimJ/RimL family protein N-acetyltransferase
MEILLRDVIDSDLPIFFEHQREPEANQMASFPSRDRDSFMAHWSKIRKDESNILKTVLYNGQVAGNMLSFVMEGKREVGYWIGREYWGRGLATKALKMFLEVENIRPLYGVVAKHNIGSRRVLEKCGFEIHNQNDNEIILVLH